MLNNLLKSPAKHVTPSEEKEWSALAHLGGIIWFIPSLFIYITFKKHNLFVKTQAKQACNFTLTMSLFAAIFFALSFVSKPMFLAIIPTYIFLLFFSIKATLDNNKDKTVKYPIKINFIK